MEKIKEKLNSLKLESESWQEKYEELREQLKELEQSNTEKENEINIPYVYILLYQPIIVESTGFS